MDFYKTLVGYIETHDKKALLKRMGYVRPKKGEKYLKTFLAAGSLKRWLEGSHFDFVHNSESFVKS